jgi:glycine hydroxymethyltransferase
MVFLAMLEPGDTIMSLNLANGGHLSHLHATSNFLKFFKLVNYDVKETAPDTFDIDQDDYHAKLREHKPKLVIIGFSAYPRAYEFAQLTKWAHEAGALVLADIAHINGLVAAGLHDTPFKAGDEGADFVSMTTHKTFRGPRGAMLFAKKDHIGAINKTIFPGTSGGPHLHHRRHRPSPARDFGRRPVPGQTVIQRLLTSRPRHLQSPGAGPQKALASPSSAPPKTTSTS